MEIRHLRLVQAVARLGTLSSASKELNLTQSALSHQLKEAELELGTPLFHRMRKRLVISNAGKIMLRAATNIMHELEQATAEISQEICGESRTINLSTHCYTCYHWLPKLLTTFSKDHPNIRIQIQPDHTREPWQGLLDRDLDLVITHAKHDDQRFGYEELFWDEQLAVVNTEHPWAVKDHIEAEDFSEADLIIYYGPLEGMTLYEKILRPNQIKPRSVIEMQLTEAAIELIKSGFGIKVMASWATQPYLQDPTLKAIPITRNGLYRSWHLAYLKDEGWKDIYDRFRVHLVDSMKSR